MPEAPSSSAAPAVGTTQAPATSTPPPQATDAKKGPEASNPSQKDPSAKEGSVVSQEMSADEAADAIDEAEESGEISEKEAKALRKKFKVKAFGKDKEIEIDPNDDEQLQKYLQKAVAFDERSQEFAGFKNDVNNFFKSLKENPESILEEMGLDVDDFAYKRLDKKVKEFEKTPEQREQEKMQQELEELRAERERLKQEKEQKEQEAVLQKTISEIQKGISDALTNTKTILPKNNPKVVARIATAMKLAMSKGYENIQVADVIPYVEKQYREEIRELFDVSPEDVIEEVMGKGNYDRIRKKKVAAAKAKRSTNTMTANQAIKDTGASVTQKSSEKPPEKIDTKDFFKKLGRR